MALILDTNALSAFADGDKTLLRVLEDESELALPVVALGEYLYGIRRSRLRKTYEEWLDANTSMFMLLSIGRETSKRYAEIRYELKTAGTPIPTNDLWIAALAREHHLPVLSRDSHFHAVRNLRRIAW